MSHLQAEDSARVQPGYSSQRSVEALAWSVVADISQAAPQLPPELPMRPHRPQKPPTPLVDPAEVQSSPSVRAQAWAGCLAAATTARDERFVDLVELTYRFCFLWGFSLS